MNKLSQRMYTVQHAVDAAKARLNGRPMSATFWQNRSRTELLTLDQVNDLADEIVSHSNFYNQDFN